MKPEFFRFNHIQRSNQHFPQGCFGFSQYGPTRSDLTREATPVAPSEAHQGRIMWAPRFDSRPRRSIFKRHLISYLFTALSRDLKFKIACIFNSKLNQGRRRRSRRRRSKGGEKKFHVHFATFWQTWPPLAGVEGLCGTKVGPLAVPGLKAIGATD